MRERVRETSDKLLIFPSFLLIGSNIQLMDFYEGSFQDFLGHNDSLHTVKFSPDGRLLFTAAANEIFVWEMAR